ncbi:MAG: EAL domain-containing protein [Hyphomicrobiaceae bacterium]
MLPRLISIPLLATFLAAIISVAGIGVYQGVVDQQNRRQLDNLAENTLRRSELAVDLVVMTVADILISAKTDCGAQSINALRKAAFKIGTIKDIHLVLPTMHCSALVDMDPNHAATLAASPHYPTKNSEITLSQIDIGDLSGLAVTWRFSKNKKFVAILDLDALLFDVLPSRLRDSAAIEIKLADQFKIATFGELPQVRPNRLAAASFAAASKRYPVSVQIQLPRMALASWNQGASGEAQFALFVIAILLSIFTARGLLPKPSQLDELDRALASGEIVPYFQPIVSLLDNTVIGCEMLARWIKPDGRFVSPGVFIPLAEANGRANKLMEVLLAQAGRSIGATITARPDFKFCFNVTPEQFLSPGFAQHVESIARGQSLPLHQLVVEVTERQEISCGDAARNSTEELNRLGVRVAIDDAGTGHNGLSSIQTLGAQFLKIDKLFIDRIAFDERNKKLVDMLIDVGRDYQMSAVAEGIEQADQIDALLSLGATEGQGFLFSPAVDGEKFNALCDANVINPRVPADKKHGIKVAA